MKRLMINCDIGERGAGHPVDAELMRHIAIANLACGGHAGDAESLAAFTALAQEHRVELTAHLSYPDRANFGRVSVELSPIELCAALDRQRSLIPGLAMAKFHGALYNDAAAQPALAGVLAQWLRQAGFHTVLTPSDSALATACREQGIAILAEAFAERRYVWNAAAGRLALSDRKKPYACLETLAEALDQAADLARGEVAAVIAEDQQGAPVTRRFPLAAQTLCIHSDSVIALPLARALGRGHLEPQ